MSKRVDELEQQVRELQEELADAEREVLEVSGANGRLAAQLDKAETTTRGLAEENATLKASLEAMRIEDLEAGFAS
jgi:small-conductance mechanosensitive channel